MKVKRLFAVSLILSACGGSEYSEIKNSELYSIGAKKLNSRLSTEYELKAGADISVELSVEKRRILHSHSLGCFGALLRKRWRT